MHTSLSSRVFGFLVQLFSIQSDPLVYSFRLKLKYLLGYFFINLTLLFCFIAFKYVSGLDLPDSKLEDVGYIKGILPFVLILGCSVFPLIEESVHRLFISHPNKIRWSLFFLVLYFVMISDYSFFRCFVFFAYLVFLLIVSKISIFREKVLLVFLGSSFFFAVFHFFGYKYVVGAGMFYPMIAVVPQFLTGLVLCYVHLKLGFGWGVVHHGIVNLVLVLLLYMLI